MNEGVKSRNGVVFIITLDGREMLRRHRQFYEVPERVALDGTGGRRLELEATRGPDDDGRGDWAIRC